MVRADETGRGRNSRRRLGKAAEEHRGGRVSEFSVCAPSGRDGER